MKLESRKGSCAPRLRAEKQLAKDGKRPETEATHDSTALIHELRAHQIELEMQNEELRRTEEALRQSKEELMAKSRRLEELNIALKVLLDQRDREKRSREDGFSQSIDGLILPYLEKIRKTGITDLQEQYLHVLEANLRDIVKPFGHRISGRLMRLTPAEIKIMNLVKQGLSIKNIASMLNISPRTVEFHRDNLRKKLGITDRRVNLGIYLSALE